MNKGILYLGPRSQLCDYMRERGHAVYRIDQELAPGEAAAIEPDLVVSYNYRQITLHMNRCPATHTRRVPREPGGEPAHSLFAV